MRNFPPNINPELFSVLACITGYVAEADFNANELNSIGNWIILVGQFLLTTAAQQQLINSRYANNVGSNIKSDVNNHQYKNPQQANIEDIDNIMQILNVIQNELNNIKKTSN